jgi:hypothetical protein
MGTEYIPYVFQNSRADARTSHRLRPYQLTQPAAIVLATRYLAAEGQRSGARQLFKAFVARGWQADGRCGPDRLT